MGILSLYFAIVIGYEYTKIFADEDELDVDPVYGALLSVFAYFLTIPQLFVKNGAFEYLNVKGATINGWTVGGNSLDRLSTSGMFTAILMAILAVQLYKTCIKRNWVVKMPEAVPSGVARSFSALIPAAVVAFVVLIINGIFISLGTDIYNVVAIPFGFVKHIANSWLGIVVIYLLVHALWIVGIHGANIVTLNRHRHTPYQCTVKTGKIGLAEYLRLKQEERGLENANQDFNKMSIKQYCQNIK